MYMSYSELGHQSSINKNITYLVTGVSINAAVLIALADHVILQNINHAGHLTEHQHAVTALLHLAQQLVQQDHLATIHVQVFSHGILGTVLHAG